MKNLIKIGIMAVAMAAGASVGHANSITLGNVGGPSGGVWTYSYSFANSFLKPLDYFTINDFGPATVVLPATTPVGWVFSQALTGPNSTAASDNATVLNATWTYMGAAGAVADGTALFSLLATIGGSQGHDYTSLDQSASSGGVFDSTVKSGVFGPQTVPDAGTTMALLGIALTGLGIARRKLA